jgi:3-hydroxyisobutyrate dehydrogenase-like beta-hydroxyacid dehydrogenase
MRIGVLGTGSAGQAIATRLLQLGDLSGARGAEMYVALWARLYGTLDTADFKRAIAR